MIDTLTRRSQEALIRATIWAFIGSLYGMIFIFFHNLSQHWLLPISPLLLAGTLAGTIAALIYSSMSLAVIVSSISSIVCLLFVLNSGHDEINLLYMTLTNAIAGTTTGAVYGLTAKNSRIFRADAKTLAGVSAGGVVSLFILALLQLLPGIPIELVIAIACLLTGMLYITLAPFYVQRFHNLLPPVLDGAMVGAGTSVFIALLFFVMISGVTPEATGHLQHLTENIRTSFITGSLGGMLGGGISGFISGMMLKQWQDL